LFRQYLHWYTKHVVGEKPDVPELPALELEIIEEAKPEEKVTVEAFGTGKTGFID
jgi:hypothetical protein